LAVQRLEGERRGSVADLRLVSGAGGTEQRSYQDDGGACSQKRSPHGCVSGWPRRGRGSACASREVPAGRTGRLTSRRTREWYIVASSARSATDVDGARRRVVCPRDVAIAGVEQLEPDGMTSGAQPLDVVGRPVVQGKLVAVDGEPDVVLRPAE